MATKKLTSREFNQDTGRAKKAAQDGPVYITDRGKPSHVLLTFADYQRLAANRPSIIDLLAQQPGIEDVEFDAPVSSETARSAEFDGCWSSTRTSLPNSARRPPESQHRGHRLGKKRPRHADVRVGHHPA